MSDKHSTDQYGRKTWNAEAYAEEGRRGKKESGPSQKALHSVKSLNDHSYLQHRTDLLKESVLAVSKHTLVNSESNATTTYGKNKRFGFFCPVCDLSFRDTLALVDHVNSPQHAKKAQSLAEKSGTTHGGDIAGVKSASAEEVASTIEELVKQLLRAKASNKEVVSLQERIKMRQEFEARKLAARREKRKRQKLAKKVVMEVEHSEIADVMGFGGFGSTKAG